MDRHTDRLLIALRLMSDAKNVRNALRESVRLGCLGFSLFFPRIFFCCVFAFFFEFSFNMIIAVLAVFHLKINVKSLSNCQFEIEKFLLQNCLKSQIKQLKSALLNSKAITTHLVKFLIFLIIFGNLLEAC